MAFDDFKRRVRQFSRDYRPQWSLAFIIGGALLLLFSIVGVFGIEALNVSVFAGFNNAVGNWVYWLFILAIIILIVGGGYYYGYTKRFKEFEELMDTESKAQFVRNQTRVEYLAWRLGDEFEAMVAEKKQRFRIRK